MHILHRIQSNLTDLVAALVIAALIVVVPAPSFAQQQSAAAQKPVAKAAPHAEEEDASPATKKPGEEGIKVHGHWIIDVKDKNGKIVEHRDFYNSLQDPTMIALFMSGQAVVNTLAISVTGAHGTYVIYPSSSAGHVPQVTCGSQFYSGVPNCSPNLKMTLQGSADDGTGKPHYTGFTLSGQLDFSNGLYPNETLSAVATQTAICLPNSFSSNPSQLSATTPTQCIAATNSDAHQVLTFTGTTLATPLSVSGQTVSVSVAISFS